MGKCKFVTPELIETFIKEQANKGLNKVLLKVCDIKCEKSSSYTNEDGYDVEIAFEEDWDMFFFTDFNMYRKCGANMTLSGLDYREFMAKELAKQPAIGNGCEITRGEEYVNALIAQLNESHEQEINKLLKLKNDIVEGGTTV